MIDDRVIHVTERRNPSSWNMDLLPTEDLLRLINREDHRVAEAIRIVIPAITKQWISSPNG